MTRIAITGMGVVCNQGVGQELMREGLFYKEVSSAEEFSGKIPNFFPEKYIPSKYLERMDRSNHLAMTAIGEAIQQSRLPLEYSQDIGIITANALCGVEFTAQEAQKLGEKGPGAGSKYFSLAFFPFGTVGMASIIHGIHGFSQTIESSQTGSLQALQLAAQMIKIGKVRWVLAGATEAPLIPLIQNAYAQKYGSMHAQYLSEAAVFFVLEAESTAVQRGAHVLETLEELLWQNQTPFWDKLLYSVCGNALSVNHALQFAAQILSEKVNPIAERVKAINQIYEQIFTKRLMKEKLYDRFQH
jgi:3-oxoacyl-(acyl-carrier-protein) synthase